MDKTTQTATPAQPIRARMVFGSAFVLSFLFNVLRLTGPLFMLLIYDRVLSSRSEETLVTLFILVVVFLIAMGLFDYARRRLLARLGGQLQEDVEKRLFQGMPRRKFYSGGIRKPVAGMDEVDGLRGYLHSEGIISVLDFIWTPMFLAVIFLFHPVLGAVAIGGVAVLVLVSVIRAFTGRSLDRNAQASSRRIIRLKDAGIHTPKTLVGQSMTGAYVSRWMAARRQSRDDAISLNDWTGAFPVIVRQMRMLLQYTVLAVGAYLVLQGKLSVGAMVATVFLVLRVFVPVEKFIINLPATRRALRQWRGLRGILEALEPVTERGELTHIESHLSLRNVNVRAAFGSQPILKSVSVDFIPGGLVEILGASNSGKTVLAETILGMWPLSSGQIQLGGANVDQFTTEQIEARFGYVPEQPEFVAGTIEENLSRLALEPSLPAVIDAAKRVGLHERITALPEGYLTRMDAKGSGFSRGERNLLAMARALYGAPDILIVDSPDEELVAAFETGSPLSEWADALKARGGTLIFLSRYPLPIKGKNGRLVLSDGRLQLYSQAKNVTSFEEKRSRLQSRGPTA